MNLYSWTPRRTGLGLLGALALSLQGAPIPKLYNTGVDDTGALLGAGVVDPHYQIFESADPAFPGPEAFTLTAGFPVGPWLAEGPNSRWIAPQASQATGNEPGNYIYRTTFDLTGFDPAKARISGQWTSDNAGVDVLLNGVSLWISQGGNFGAFNDFLIETEFMDGLNTLDFVVNNAGDAVNPTGLRVEMIGTVELPGEPPRLINQPVGTTVIVGDPVMLSVVADGAPPLTYQWKLDGADVAGATEPTLFFEAITADQGGDYTVLVSNDSGQTNSALARVRVLEPIAGLVNTGVGIDGFPLDDGLEDPHYRLVVNPDDPSVTQPLVQDSQVFPIVEGPWIANSETSKWIGPQLETSAAAGGDYVYEIEVDLTGFDPTTAFIEGRWATDNGATLVLNGTATAIVNSGDFGNLSSFRLETGFLSGTNRLGFRVNNAGAGYTGLRVDGLRGGALQGSVGEAPRIVSQPVGGLLLAGDSLELSVVADGAPPLIYQWRQNDVDLTGQTRTTLPLNSVGLAEAGSYTVVVANSISSLTSNPAVVTILGRVPGIFDTGVDANGVVLEDASIDPHYRLVVNATDPGWEDAFVHDSTIFPIVSGPWVANTDRSKWIAPLPDSSSALGGDYAYQTTFDLTGFDPATAVLLGNWATDNLGTDIKINGTSTGLQNGTQFNAFTPFTVSAGFVAGTNVLEFLLNNADPETGYTGLRVDNLRVGALPVSSTTPAVSIQLGTDEVTVSWPASAIEYQLYSATVLTQATWNEVSGATIEGDRMTVKVPVNGTAQFFQLQAR